MAEPFSLKDQLFNEDTIGQLAAEHAAALPGFDGPRFQSEVMAGLAGRGLLERLEWMADCLEKQLAPTFPAMADQLEAAMPPPLDPSLSDGDFGRFIHALPGILAVRHGLEDHRERALDLLYAATKRFSMEFYIRPFLDRWPQETLARLDRWAEDENYHVRRLVSEGTRPRLPWARTITLAPDQTLPLLEKLHADPTRYVTRSVANHLNDISKSSPDLVIDRLARWSAEGRQDPKELAWMTRHALRTLVKRGHGGALELLGFRRDIPVQARLTLTEDRLRIGAPLVFRLELTAPQRLPVLVDYRLRFARPGGKTADKVFKLKTAVVPQNEPLILHKTHPLRGDTTTYKLHPGEYEITVQVNGLDVAQAMFCLR